MSRQPNRGQRARGRKPVPHVRALFALLLALLAIIVLPMAATAASGTQPAVAGSHARSSPSSVHTYDSPAHAYDVQGQQSVPSQHHGTGRRSATADQDPQAERPSRALTGSAYAAESATGDVFGSLDAVRADTGAAVAARLDVNGESYIGTNLARGNSPIKGTMSFFVQHAEGDAFAQALKAGDLSGQSATMYVSRAPCGFCVSSITAVVRSSGLSELTVVTPDGVFGTYTPAAGLIRP